MSFRPPITRISRTRLFVEELESRLAPAAVAGNDLLWKTYTPADTFKLHSNPGVNQVIYLDFDGATVSGTQWNTDANGGSAFTVPEWSMDGNRSAFSAAEQAKIVDLWRMVAEDFAPFNIDVTTQDPGLESLRKTSSSDTKWGMHVILGPVPTTSNSSFWAGAGGIAYLNSFNDNIDTPCFVFNGDSSGTPEDSLPVSVSHEVGHTFGLSHDGTASLGYYSGHGSGATGWGPIMGAPFGQNLTQWSRDTYPGANNPEDDLAKIATGHGFSYRPDDYSNTSGAGKTINLPLQASLKTTYGLIERNTDVDYLRFYANPGPLSIQIDPLFVGPNLDILAELYAPSGALVASSNPAATLDASFSMNVSEAGLYSLKITGTGLPGATGYPKYGSLGSYRVTGTVEPYIPAASAFRAVNPARWTYNAVTGIQSGYITISNATSAPFIGTFTIELTIPSNITVTIPNSTRVGNKISITIRGTLSSTSPFRIFVQVSNPGHVALATGFHTWVTKIEAAV
jgi:hypothetical protein